MSDLALPNVALPTGMVTVADLLRRLSPVAPEGVHSRAAFGIESAVERDAAQLPIEMLLEREGRSTGSIPAQRPPFDQPARKPAARRSLAKIAVAVGAVATAGTVIAGGLWLSQPSIGQQPVVDAEQGSYPGEAGSLGTGPPADGLFDVNPFGAPGSAFSTAFPDLAAAGAGSIPATGGSDLTPAGSNGAPPSVVPPAVGGGAPLSAPGAQGGGAASAQDGGAASNADQSGETGEAARSSGAVSDTVDTVTDVGDGAVGTVGSLLGTVGGLR